MGFAPAGNPASAVFSAARHPAVARGIAAVVPHHLARGLVGQQRQEHKPRFRPKVSDISHPNLVGLAHRQPLDPVGKHRQTVMGIGRAGIFRRPGFQQQVFGPQHFHKPVPPQAHPFLVQHAFEHKMQLPGPRRGCTFLSSSTSATTRLGLHHAALPRLASRVIILPGDPHPAAHPADAHPKLPAFQLYGFMPGGPAAFFLNSATSAIPARRHAIRV